VVVRPSSLLQLDNDFWSREYSSIVGARIKPEQYINANYIKSSFKEEPLHLKNEVPFGYIIATQGPQTYSEK